MFFSENLHAALDLQVDDDDGRTTTDGRDGRTEDDDDDGTDDGRTQDRTEDDDDDGTDDGRRRRATDDGRRRRTDGLHFSSIFNILNNFQYFSLIFNIVSVIKHTFRTPFSTLNHDLGSIFHVDFDFNTPGALGTLFR